MKYSRVQAKAKVDIIMYAQVLQPHKDVFCCDLEAVEEPSVAVCYIKMAKNI